MTALTTPVPDGTNIGELIGGLLFGRSQLFDSTGADAMGQVVSTPAANSLLGRLKALQDLLTLTNGFVDGIETLLGAATPAGENYTGKIGGDVLAASATPTVSTTQYTSGDVIGVKMSFAALSRVAAGSGLIQSVIIDCKSAQTGAVDLLLFSADPSASTFTDNGPLAVNAADYDKLIGVIHITDWTNLGAAISVAQSQNVGMPFKLPAGTTIYGVLVARSTPTLGSTSDIKITLNVIPG